MTELVAATKSTVGLIASLDPSLKEDFIQAIGLRSSQKDFEAALPEHGAEAGIAEQLRAVGEIARLAKDTADRNQQTFRKALWQLEDNITETVRKEVRKHYEGKDEPPPERVHVRRAVEETVDAMSRVSSHDEEALLIEIFLASLTREGGRDALGVRLRKLVTSGQIGPAEIRELRSLAREADEATQQATGRKAPRQPATIEQFEVGRIDTVLVMARTRPALVVAVGRTAQGMGYVSRFDQLAPSNVHVHLTSSGKEMLRLLTEARARLDEMQVLR